jgi:hypothetical protein
VAALRANGVWAKARAWLEAAAVACLFAPLRVEPA